MNKLNFECTGGPYGDATSNYNITFPKGMTVSQFIAAALKEDNKWGEFKLDNCFGQVLAEYNGGEIYSHCIDFVTKWRDKTIIEAKANGGWGNMDYYLVLGNPEPDAIMTYDKDEYYGHWLICQKCGSKHTPAYGQYCCECGHKFEIKHDETRIEWNERYCKGMKEW